MAMNPDKALLFKFMADQSVPVAVDSNPLAGALRCRLLAADAATGEVRLDFEPDATFLQGNNAVQGGAVAAMLDFAMAFSALAVLPEEQGGATTSMTVNYLKAVKAGRYEAIGILERKGRTMVFVRGELRTPETGALVGDGDIGAGGRGLKATGSNQGKMMKPLDGIRVLSLATQYPGPFATMLLSDMGADVVIVERPGTGDPGRINPDLFSTLNRGKRSLAMDLKTEKDKNALLRLVDKADVFIEGFRPGVAARLGFGYEALSARNPRLVYASISGYGQTGPYRDHPAHDLSLQALVGLLHGRESTAARGPYMAWADLASGTFGALGIVAALRQRDVTGKGAEVDVAMSDTLAVWTSGWLGPALNGAEPIKLEFPGYGCYECADGKWLCMSITFEDHFWRPFAEIVGLKDYAGMNIAERGAKFDEVEDALKQAVAETSVLLLGREARRHGRALGAGAFAGAGDPRSAFPGARPFRRAQGRRQVALVRRPAAQIRRRDAGPNRPVARTRRHRSRQPLDLIASARFRHRIGL